MKKLSALCIALCVGLSTSAALARGGSGSHHSAGGSKPVTGGAFGTNPTTPGTNSLGTALSSNGVGNGPLEGTPYRYRPGHRPRGSKGQQDDCVDLPGLLIRQPSQRSNALRAGSA